MTPGMWKTKSGEELRIQDMEDSHIKNSMRLLRTRILSRMYGPAYIKFCEDKLIELGNDAQRRGLIPAGNIPMHELIDIITGWQTAWDNRPPRPPVPGFTPIPPPIALIPVPRTPTPAPIATSSTSTDRYSRLRANDDQVRSFRRVSNVSPPPLVSKHIDVEFEISRVTGFRVGAATAYSDTFERRLDMDL